MYAAAGGASIASRKARQNKALIKGGQKKPPAKGAKHLTPKVEKPQSKQFHHLPDNYHKHAESSGGLAPPSISLNHSRSLTLRADEEDGPGLRPSRSAHDLPPDAAPHGLEPGVVGAAADVGSPPRAYTCPHWEGKLTRAPADRIVAFGSADVPYALCECAQGKAAWQEAAVGAAAARRCSVAAEGGAGGHRTKQTEAHLRWMKRNRIHDLSYGGSSSDEEDGAMARAANAAGGLLYVGLGTVALGLVISFVGTGEKGFKTVELRYCGPALICAGLLFCLVRILLCACPQRCRPPRARARPKEPAAERLLLAERPRLPFQPPYNLPPPQPSQMQPSQVQSPQARPPQTQSPPRSPVRVLAPVPVPVPTPVSMPTPLPAPMPTPMPTPLPTPMPTPLPTPLPTPTLDESSFDISSLSSSEVDGATVIEAAGGGKLSRGREPAHARRAAGCSLPRTVTFADTPNVFAPPSEAPPPAAEIVLTPSSLGRE